MGQTGRKACRQTQVHATNCHIFYMNLAKHKVVTIKKKIQTTFILAEEV
jgi:hypothetical protein